MNNLTQNSKLKKTSKHFNKKVFNFGIPAYKSESGKLTCPFADKCIKFCYAKKGAYTWGNVKPAFERRYQLTKTDKFVEVMDTEIKKKKADYIRVHDSGDYYSPKYLKKWLEIAYLNPEVRFYSYTNSIQFIKDLKVIPDNFDFIFSDSGKQVDLINKDKDRHTKIFKNKSDLVREGYIDTSNYDLYATKWYNETNKVGLIIH
mgnify:CR=1